MFNGHLNCLSLLFLYLLYYYIIYYLLKVIYFLHHLYYNYDKAAYLFILKSLKETGKQLLLRGENKEI